MYQNRGFNISTSKKKVLAAFIETHGNAAEAARIARVSRQYVYEVLNSLRGRGFRIRALPSFAALGRVFFVFSAKGSLPLNTNTIAKLSVYMLNGTRGEAAVYLVPREMFNEFKVLLPPNSSIFEVFDVIPAAPQLKLAEIKVEGDFKLPEPPRTRIDKDDIAIIEVLNEDLSNSISRALPDVSKSRLSYHYRKHVKPLLRIFIDPALEGFYTKPLLLAEMKAHDESTVAMFLKVEEAYIVVPKVNRVSAFVLFDVDDVYAFLKTLFEVRERKNLNIEISLIGFVDPFESTKLMIPHVLRAF
ncbi:MAG: hypothetical protein QXY49_04815 [Thermofilaceae archaeon]